MAEAPDSAWPWCLTVICGPQGVGKTTVAAQLADELGATLIHFDDHVMRLRATTTGDPYPNLHYRATQPEMEHGRPGFVALRFRVAEELRQTAADLIESIARKGELSILEGDYLLPPTHRPALDGHTAWVVLTETDPRAVVSNFSRREPDVAPQRKRAETSIAVGRALAVLAGRAGVPVVAASPHDTAMTRLKQAVWLAWSSG